MDTSHGLPGGHAYAAGVSTTGGVGSKQYPANGKQSAVKFSLFGVISVMATPGGGGGGNLLPGKRGIADWVDPQGKPHVDYNKEIGPAPDGGTALGWDAVKPTNADSLKHHQAGGSGGGGAGSHPLGTIDPNSGGDKISFNSGRGGAACR